MDQLWAGWRQAFIEGNAGLNRSPGCVLCSLGALGVNAVPFVVFRAEFNYVVLNAYPYAPGHLMVVPYEHCGDLLNLSKSVLIEITELLQRCVAVLTDVYAPGGFNVGANLGRAGGAAFDDHIHFHVVPRWLGDTNFMTSLANTRVMPESLDSSYERIMAKWPETS